MVVKTPEHIWELHTSVERRTIKPLNYKFSKKIEAIYSYTIKLYV